MNRYFALLIYYFFFQNAYAEEINFSDKFAEDAKKLGIQIERPKSIPDGNVSHEKITDDNRDGEGDVHKIHPFSKNEHGKNDTIYESAKGTKNSEKHINIDSDNTDSALNTKNTPNIENKKQNMHHGNGVDKDTALVVQPKKDINQISHAKNSDVVVDEKSEYKRKIFSYKKKTFNYDDLSIGRSTKELSKLLFLAVKLDDITAIEAVISAGAEINSVETDTGYTPLMFAIKGNNISSLKYLIHRGANINTRAKYGITPLHLAAITNKFDCLNILIKSGADLFALDDSRKNFIAYILDDKRKKIIIHDIVNSAPNKALENFIVSNFHEGFDIAMSKADLNINYHNGDTPLMLAVRSDDKKAVIALLSVGVDESLKNKRGYTALDIAKQLGANDIVAIIESVNFNKQLYLLGLANKIIPYKLTPDQVGKLQVSADIKGFYNFHYYPKQKILGTLKNQIQ